MAELQIDDLLNNFSAQGTTKKSNKDNKKAKKGNDWGDEEEDNYSFGLGKDTQQTIKPTKNTKKKTTDKGWGELAQEKKEEAPVPVIEEPQAEEPKKKGIMRKINHENTTASASINVEEEYFPTLGEEAKPQPKKKVEAPVTTSPVIEQSTGGPRRFVNANKKAAGETFAPLNPELTEKPVPERPVITNSSNTDGERKGFGFRRAEPGTQTAPTTTTTTTTTDDSKIKFGGEGPKKFVGSNKISFKREEEKSEQEVLREQREREIEEKLAKEREEQAKLREERDKRRANKEEGVKPEGGETQEQTAAPSEEKKPRFMNTKKDTSKPSNLQAAPVEKVEKEKPKTEEVVAPATEEKGHASKEVVEMNGTLSNKGWGEGPIKKAAVKK